MRRTDLDFKEEVLRRSREYRTARAKKNRKILASAICLFICICGFGVIYPGGLKSASTESAAPESMKQDSASFVRDEEAVESPAAAPMEPAEFNLYGKGESQSQTPAAGEPVNVQITRGEQRIMLGAPDATAMVSYLNGEWIEAVPNCLPDWEITVNGMAYRYHSDCGTFQNESSCSLTVSEEDRKAVNEILSKYK